MAEKELLPSCLERLGEMKIAFTHQKEERRKLFAEYMHM
jgi:hypothetical protein